MAHIEIKIKPPFTWINEFEKAIKVASIR